MYTFILSSYTTLHAVIKTRNTFCGTCYLPHSQVHNERSVPIITAGCIVHAQNGHISILV